MAYLIRTLLVLFVLTYISSIIKSLISLNEVISCLKVLAAYSRSAEPDPFHIDISGDKRINKQGNYDSCFDGIMMKYPTMAKLLNGNIAILDYGASDYSNYRATVKIYTDLLMLRNFYYQIFKDSFVPVGSLKKLFLLPGSLLNWLGISAKVSFSRVFSLLCWTAAYFLGMYSNELKALINLIIQRISGT